MAGTYKARAVRGKYAQAGYVKAGKMYIADVPAGSRQDELRDFNRAGYRSDRPWNEEPVFEAMEAAPALEIPHRARARQQSFLDRLMIQIRRERKDAIACAILMAVILTMGVAWGRNMVAAAQIQHSINTYHASAVAFERENERIEQQLELARGGERIRNLAQNELGMLRPERATTKTIYIQSPAISAEKTLQNQDEPRMEVLDILLGLLNVLHIGE